VAVLVAIAAAGCRAERPPLHADAPSGRWVVVEAGQTLDGLAAEAGVPAADVLEINGLERAADVRVGQLLFLLAPEPDSGPGGALPATASVRLDGARPALRWPLGSRVVVGSAFGARDGRRHEGIDLPAPTGTPVYAAADGRVAYAGNGVRGYGNMVVLRHAGDLLTVYAHNAVLLVSQGAPVRAGDRIALVGQSGRATGPHLHFEVRAGQIPQDPMPLLPEPPR
jgi:murein DD-endopeptidase MepM/ murein hydrolase activator NlpD